MNISRTALIIALLLSFLGTVSVSSECGAQANPHPNLVTGQITSAIILQERIHLTLGDKAVTNLGAEDGVIKGDILTITAPADINLEKQIGKCAVLDVGRKSSVCQIVSANMEIKRGSRVSIGQASLTLPRLFSAAYTLLSKSVEAYEPNEKIAVFIHNIFDDQGNVTQLSNRIREQIEKLFTEKKRIRIVKAVSHEKDLTFYPNLDSEQYPIRHEFMDAFGVDVLVSGSYSVQGDTLYLTLYKFDRRFGDTRLAFNVPMAHEQAAEAKQLIKAYQSIPKREYVTCTVTYQEYHYTPQKDEIKEIVNREAGNDLFKVNDLKKTNFNLISPVDIVIKINDKTVNFLGKQSEPFPLTKGTHRLYAAFKRGYFFNTREPLLHVSDKAIEKEALLSISKDGTYLIEASFRPFFEANNIGFKVYSIGEKRVQVPKTILRSEATKSIEFFKD